MSAILTLAHNPKNNQLVLSTSQFTIGNQYSNNTITLTLSRLDKYTQFIPYLIIQPEFSKPFSPMQFTNSFTLSNLFTQTTYIDVQVVLKSNYNNVYSNIVRLHLTPALVDNSPIDITGIYNRPVSISRATKIITKSDLRIEEPKEDVNYDDIIEPHNLLDESNPVPDNTETVGGSNDTTDNITTNPDSNDSINNGDNVTDSKDNVDSGTVDGDTSSGENNPDSSVETPPATDTEDKPDPDYGVPEEPTPPSVSDDPVITPDSERSSFEVLINTPFYTMNSNHLLVYLNGKLLSFPEYMEIGNGISSTITIHSLLLNPDDKLEFISFG